MTSTFSPSLRLELMATGDQSGTWGDTTNTNLGTLLEQAITGYLSVAQGDVANLTLTTVNGGSDQARNAVVNITGALLAQRNVVVQTANKLYLFKNATTGGFAINVKTAAGTGVLVANGASRLVYSDGTNVVDGQFGPLLPSSDDGGALGSATIEWSDLFLASGGVLNWANGNVTLTHSSALLTSNATIASSGSSVGYVAFQAISTEAAAAAGPIIDIYRNSASPAANDVLGQAIFNGQNSTPAKKEYADISALIVSPTAAAEGGALQFSTISAGTVAARALIGVGVYTAGATGGDKGANTINVSTYYKDGGYGVVTLGSPTASTSGTTIDFTGIPSGVKTIVASFVGVTINATTDLALQIGDSGGIETTGYLGAGAFLTSTPTAGVVQGTTLFNLTGGGVSSSAVVHGAVTLTLVDASTNTWSLSGTLSRSDTGVAMFASGSKSLSPGPLDRVRFTTGNGTATFTAGKVNIAYS